LSPTRYRTEIEIPEDRYVCLHLPAHLPVGRATVTVVFHDAPPAAMLNPDPLEPDHEDIEWWEEFDNGDEPIG
jgi:hypothetical protein